jgi:hypothetical protein
MCRAACFAVAAVMLVAPLAQADLKVEHVQRAKEATALVVLPSGGFGAAFCVDEAGYFITNKHVVQGIKEDEAISMVLHVGTKAERTISSKVVRADEKGELALLRVDETKDLKAIALGSETKLVETMSIAAFGFPPSDRFAIQGKKYPSISVNVGRVTSLQRAEDKLESIQIDASLNAGNVGGPVLDDDGKVIGVVRAGTRLRSLVPISQVREFLSRIELSLAPAAVAFEKRHQPATFEIQAVSFSDPNLKLSVELQLEVEGADARRFAAKQDKDGVYRVVVAPIEEARGTASIPVKVLYTSGAIEGAIEDQLIGIGEEKLLLSKITHIEFAGDRSRVVTKAGKERVGKLTNVGQVNIDLGGTTSKVNLSKASRLVIRYFEPQIDKIRYKVVASKGDQPIRELIGQIPVTGIPTPSPSVASIDVPELASEKTMVRLPAAIEQVAYGGGGRFIVLHLKRLNQLAIFDVSRAKVVRYLDAPAGDFLFTCGAKHLIIADDERNTLERWSLDTFEKEVSVDLPLQPVHRAALGAQLVSLAALAGTGQVSVYRCPDDETGRMKQTKKITGSLKPYSLQIEPVPDGSGFALWNRRQHSDYGGYFATVRMRGNDYVLKSSSGSGVLFSPVHASVNEGYVFSGNGLVFTADLQPVPAPKLKDALLMPVGTGLFVATRWTAADPKANPTESKSKATMDVHFVNHLSRAFSIGNVEELDGISPAQLDPSPFASDQRILLLPDSNLLVTIGNTNDYLVLRKIDVDAGLRASGEPFLFVRESAVPPATKGQDFRYSISTRSSTDQLSFALDNAPDGMRLSPAGELTWQVPADYSTGKAAVIVRITSSDRQQVFHSFQIDVQ